MTHPDTASFDVVSTVIRVRLFWNGDQIERIEPTTTLDPMRDRAVRAVNIGLQNGRQLQLQALQTLALQELIAQLIRLEPQ